MDHDNPGMTSETEEKENSSTNGDHSSRLCSEEDCTNPTDNDPARILQLSQPFFVADTCEDDESMIIPPTQEDSAPFMIPSTPISANKNDRTSGEIDPNASTVSILEETCVDLEDKSEHNDSSKEDANQISNTSCNESDLTQDLDLEPTQPIIPSNPVEDDFNKMSNDADKKNDDDDDDWQLKFSETQTQDLLNFEKSNEKEKEMEQELPDTTVLSKEPDKKDEEEDDDDDLPATLVIEVPERLDEKDYDSSMNMPKHDENVEVVDLQSDDEIEPSQSCLSEYKGETISTSFKIQASVDIHNSNASVKEIPKSFSETGFDAKESIKSGEDIEIISEGEPRTINLTSDLSASESKDVLDVESNEEISIEEKKDGKEVEQKENSVNDVEEKEMKETEKSDNMEVEIVADVKEKSLPGHNRDSVKSPFKTCSSTEVELIETNGESVEEMKTNEDAEIEEMELDEDKSAKITEVKEKGPKKLNKSDGPKVVICDKLGNDEIREEENVTKSKDESVDGLEVMDVESENKIEVRDKSAEEKSFTKLNIKEADKNEVTEVQIENKEAELVNENVDKDLGATDVEPLQKTSEDDSTTAQSDIPVKNLTPVIDLKPNKVTSEVEQASTKQIADEKAETPPTSFLPPLPGRSYGSMRKKLQNKVVYHEASIIDRSDKKVCIGSYKDIKSLEKFLKSIGISLDKEKMEAILLKQNEELEIRPVFSLANQKIFLREYAIESEHHRQDSGISPISSSSTTASSTLSYKASTHSGDADISSSLSGKSNSCGIQMDSTTQSINILSSQDTSLEMLPKTSTQISHEPIVFSDVFGKKTSVESKSKSDVSPIKSSVKSEKGVKSSIPKRKRGGKKNAESSSNETSSSNEPKRKRGRVYKPKGAVEDKGEETEESKDIVVEVKPRKATRRKKGATIVPDIKPEDVKLPVEDVEISMEDDASVQEEANFGSILPGVKVMARWKDGYYYSGMVQSQELDGKWAVQFEDGFLRTIAPENLIKIAILPKGTSVLVQSPDDYYDPGIVCGHFREGSKVGYEVELDNGVTRRYPRSFVILSGDQAKVIMSNRPPTTPATMTINLDNIIDGKRKRKSVQSPVSSPVVKKSPRITRSKKPDSNLESTADSSAAEVISIKSKDSESEEPVAKKSKTRKGTKKNAAASKNSKATTADSSNNSKSMKVLPQRSAKRLFKDYAFLLTNADRKVAVKPPDSSDSESIREEEDIVPFNKDELCEHITSGGGIILEKFDDIKKCTRKHIFLLANSYLRTMKYIQCIAAGISCIKHHWVKDCLFKSEMLSVNSYILPSGFSLVSQTVIEWHGKTDVFKGCKIALVSAPESPFVYTWAPVLLAAKADFVQKWSLPSSVSGCSLVVDVLITNHHCPPDIIQSAKKRKIPIVSSEWIIQCLIVGKPLPYDAHPKFKYDYAEK